jgi:hypothetical protein
MFKYFWFSLVFISFSHELKADDFLDTPKSLCSYFASLGMKAQYQWGPAPKGDAYLCQYADEFGGNAQFVRGARVYVSPKSKNVGVGLSIQGFSLVRAEAADILNDYANAMYQTYNQKLPSSVSDAIAHSDIKTVKEGIYSVKTYGIKAWESQRVVGASWTRQATDKQLASLNQSITPEESIKRSTVQENLEKRCQKAVEASGMSENPSVLKMTTELLSASRYLVKFSADKSSFSCQVCDDTDPNINCGTMGLMLSHTDQDNNQVSLPAEMDRKCVFSLQKALSSRTSSFIDHELVKRIKTSEVLNDKRYVYKHEIEGQFFRCVIRKKDMNYRIERQIEGDKWKSLNTGIML